MMKLTKIKKHQKSLNLKTLPLSMLSIDNPIVIERRI
jgi:hypothetical protein